MCSNSRSFVIVVNYYSSLTVLKLLMLMLMEVIIVAQNLCTVVVIVVVIVVATTIRLVLLLFVVVFLVPAHSNESKLLNFSPSNEIELSETKMSAQSSAWCFLIHSIASGRAIGGLNV